MRKLNLGAFLFLFCSIGIRAETSTKAEVTDELPFTISGWTEVVHSVSDLQQHTRFMLEVAGWEIIDSGPVGAATLAAWQLDSNVTAEQVLVGNPGTSRGYIRLVRFDNAEQVQIRSGAQPWESGGIFDINLRVLDMAENFREFQAHGWHAWGDPVHYNFGPFEVKEWIAVGPDAIAYALIERIQPPLEGWPQLRDISRVFNSTQVVPDMPAALHFYRDILGFKKYLYWRGVSEHAEPNVLGLPHELTTEIEREVWILHPEAMNEGSVELVRFHGLSGRDLAPRAAPPNLGILMLRFPVDDLEAFIAHLEKNGVTPQGPVATTRLTPWGEARQVSVRSPSGAWLDFYQATD